jgi:hypothetical protein
MKKQIIGLTVAVSLIAGGTGYAAASLKDSLKQQYHEEVIAFMNDFGDRYREQKVDQDARIRQETSEYLNKKLAEYEDRKMKELNEWDKQEVNQVIKEIKAYIDQEIGKY